MTRTQATRSTAALALAVALLAGAARAAGAQSRAEAEAARWNDARVLELVEHGRIRRAEPLLDDELRNYRARAEGSIYFYIDPDAADPVLMRADQVAVELYWAHPDHTRQVLLGQRIEKRLPIRDFHYYIDRLTVVQNGFGDEIQVGEGMDVRNVAHPLAPQARDIYDYRLADSLVLRLPGSPPIRAYEVVVRPRRPDRPGFVGSLYLDGASGALVRMQFGFTRASYVDPRNDYVRITLDHGLWQGRYWLPNEQEVIVRRELPELDLGAGTVIRATLRVTDYEFDLDLPAAFFSLPPVTAVPREQRQAYEFERGMYDDLVSAGLAPGGDLRAIEREARRVLRERAISGLPRTRPSVPNFSSLVRYNRAEGAFAGAGVRTTLADADVLALAGYAFAAERPSLLAEIRIPAGVAGRVDGALFQRELRDVGPRGVPVALNTLAMLVTGRDYLDPWFATGGRLGATRRVGATAALRVEAAIELHAPATLAVSEPLFGSREQRPMLPLDDGVLTSVRASLSGTPPAYRGVRPMFGATLEGGAFDDAGFGAAEAEIGVATTGAGLAAAAEARLAAGTLFGEPPLQRHYFLGGPGSLPGHTFRSLAGRRYALAEAEASRTVLRPWLDARAFAAAGWTGGSPSDRVAATSERVRGSVGVGVALFHGILRIDLARGLGEGGREAVILSIDPRLRPWM